MTERTKMTAEEVSAYILRGVLPVSHDPYVSITDWSIYQVNFGDNLTSYHAVGWRDDGYRICSPIQEMMPHDRTFVTRSGRMYKLDGDPLYLTIDDSRGKAESMKRAFDFWCKSNAVTSAEDTTKLFSSYLKDFGDGTVFIKFLPGGSLALSAFDT